MKTCTIFKGMLLVVMINHTPVMASDRSAAQVAPKSRFIKGNAIDMRLFPDRFGRLRQTYTIEIGNGPKSYNVKLYYVEGVGLLDYQGRRWIRARGPNSYIHWLDPQ